MGKHIGAVVVIVAALLISAAVAAEKPRDSRPQRGAMMEKVDANGDGNVTLEEIQAVRPEMTAEKFKRLDRNGDGVLNKDDRPQEPRGRRAGRPGEGRPQLQMLLKKADANKDGSVTLEEIQAVRPEMTAERFAHLDLNHDGVVNKGDRPEEGKRAAPSRSAGALPPMMDMLKDADANADGAVTLQELQAAVLKRTAERFTRLDRNGDGVISQADRNVKN